MHEHGSCPRQQGAHQHRVAEMPFVGEHVVGDDDDPRRDASGGRQPEVLAAS